MSTRRKNVTDDVITHTSPPLSFLQSKMSSRSGPGLRRRGSREDLLWIGWLSNPTMRPFEEQVEAEIQEVRKIIKPIVDAENGLLKDLERFLGRRAVTELRRRELLHKRWTERVWLPIQRRVEDFSRRCDHEGDRMRCLNADYIRHCNAKGFVSLDCYDPQEYDPFLLSITGPLDCYKLQMPVLKDPLLMDSRERIREKRAVVSCKTGRSHTREEVKELLSRFSPPAARKPPQTAPTQTFASAYLNSISTTRETSLERGTKSSHRSKQTVWLTENAMKPAVGPEEDDGDYSCNHNLSASIRTDSPVPQIGLWTPAFLP
ncbi:protein FAM228A isoform X1 [Gadus chalcogrammus]|uniref:protein FAM228A isoform X1 n=1 Tax=Gadus chalcogrammus TaxID=1042646 RepID=UPI0024C4BDD9|nr:protein FAM228A isoform X1 [Gadus chalcogrammus]XP_056437987.1 protein FAM228A isoform X1 [Gadus chalcogrammus]